MTPEERRSPIATFAPPTLPVVRTVVPSVMELMIGSNVTLAIGPPVPPMQLWNACEDTEVNPKPTLSVCLPLSWLKK
jgi:hypothetical protein